ncbi:MAG: outer membrane lipoprotein carrier protein LolA [Bacteroidales bacterium]|jgi:outer membrane lipoprotein-sorting protein|nr:outer membrane lipoprotein carrier protein LolA [Bacteroidales bacterium]
MKKFFIFSTLFISTFALAQQDPEAKVILDKLSEKTKSYQNIQSDFTIEYKNIKDNSYNTSKGSITVKGDKYRLNFMGSESLYNGKTLWSYVAEVNEVNISEPEQNDKDIFSNPQEIFTIYTKDFKYQLMDQFSESGISKAIIDLYPNDIEEDYSRIRLEINTDKYQLKSVTIFGKDGSHYLINFNHYQTNLDIDSTYFTFNPSDYPGVEVIDMRW